MSIDIITCNKCGNEIQINNITNYVDDYYDNQLESLRNESKYKTYENKLLKNEIETLKKENIVLTSKIETQNIKIEAQNTKIEKLEYKEKCNEALIKINEYITDAIDKLLDNMSENHIIPVWVDDLKSLNRFYKNGYENFSIEKAKLFEDTFWEKQYGLDKIKHNLVIAFRNDRNNFAHPDDIDNADELISFIQHRYKESIKILLDHSNI